MNVLAYIVGIGIILVIVEGIAFMPDKLPHGKKVRKKDGERETDQYRRPDQ